MHVLGIPMDTRKQWLCGLVYVSSIIFCCHFNGLTFGEKIYQSSNANTEIHLPLSSLKISKTYFSFIMTTTETQVMFCCTQAAMLLAPGYNRITLLAPVPWTSFLSHCFFLPAIHISRETAKNVVACNVMEVVNVKTPFIFVSKTSAGEEVRHLFANGSYWLNFGLKVNNSNANSSVKVHEWPLLESKCEILVASTQFWVPLGTRKVQFRTLCVYLIRLY